MVQNARHAVLALVVVATARIELDAQAADSKSNGERPNIVWVLCDDLGWGDLGCFGHPVIRTPALDRLASEGCRLTRFYVPMPLCSPSRAAALTGRDPNRYGFRHVVNMGEVNPRVRVPLVHHLPLDEPLLPRVLQKAGYRTGTIGKWHLSLPNISSEPQPDQYGFDHYFVHSGRGNLYRGPATWHRNGEAVAVDKDVWFSDLYVDEALRFVESCGHDPFYLQLWAFTPHVTEVAAEKFRCQYADRTSQEQTYFGCVTQFDEQLGRLFDDLRARGHMKNTIVLFSSDNGPEPPVNRFGHEQARRGSTAGLRGSKHVLYEGGIRVPAILYWPGLTEPGSECDTPLSILDLFPTLALASGQATPAGWKYDGTDMAPAFRHRPVHRPHPLYFQCDYAQDTFVGPNYSSLPLALRTGPWKLMSDTKFKEFELFNLDTDPAEQFNIADEHPEQVKIMIDALREIYADINKPDPQRRHLNPSLLKSQPTVDP